jgi:LmbE family N-acetylglucosaminyl deacetylase/cytochrome c-type biogenesis protein CcmH/NrfG
MRALLALVVLLLAAAPAPAATLGELEAVTRAQPDSAEAWDRLGQALARERHFNEAQAAYARALRLAPDSRHVRAHIALAYAWNGDYAQAEKRYAELLARHPLEHHLRIDYGQTLAWDRKFAAARREYERVLSVEPRHVEALRHLAILTAWEGQYDPALALLARAEQVAPRNVALLLAKGEVLSWKGALPAAADALRQALAIAPNHAGAWLQLGQIQLWQRQPRAAAEAYRRALGLAPANVEAHLGLSRALRDNHEFAAAERQLRRALERFPAEERIGRELAALAASRAPGLSGVLEWLEPLLFSTILIVIFVHMRRYRRVLGHRRRLVRRLIYLLPLLALVTIATGGVVLLGGRYTREAAAASTVLELLTLPVLVTVVSTLIWLLRFERPARGRTILAIGAHPDDVEFGCGATLLRYREQGDITHALILTSGEKGMNGNPQPQRRLAEAQASARLLELGSVTVKDFPDTQLQTCREDIKGVIEERVQALQPDIIFTHTAHDVHSDHRAVAEATREAARGACTILGYENPNTPPEFAPDFFVDVTDYVDDKIAAIARHRSQADKPYTRAEVIRSAAAFRGTQARVRYAEAFESVRVLEKADVA